MLRSPASRAPQDCPPSQLRSHAVVLALGRTGTPRKLGVKGEDLPKVMYRLIEADHYVDKRILVVGGGDSAIEAAMGLGHQQYARAVAQIIRPVPPSKS